MNDRTNQGKRLEIALATLLLWGTIISATVIAAGGVGYLVSHGGSAPHYAKFVGEPSDLRSVQDILENSLSLDPRGVMQLGALLLIGTPIARVIAALVGFAWQRDRTYVVVCMLVLASLLYSLLAS